jgi:hypothetical protein
MLNSTLWFERIAREVFITALLMAEPYELEEATAQIEVRSLKKLDWTVPPGRYGFVPAAGSGILHRAMLSDDDMEAGYSALELLGSPEALSRTSEYGGRRLVRVDGGYIVLNFDKYRQRDYTAGIRQKRYRERKKRNAVTSISNTVTSRFPSASASASASSVSEYKKEGESEGKRKPACLKDVLDFVRVVGLPETDGHYFWSHWEGNGFTNDGKSMRDWKATIRSWKHAGHCPSQKRGLKPSSFQSYKDRGKERDRLQTLKNDMFKMKEREHRDFTEDENAEYRRIASELEQLKNEN